MAQSPQMDIKARTHTHTHSPLANMKHIHNTQETGNAL